MFLEATQVSKSYGGIRVLQTLDFQLQKGDTAAILGPSGSGKTTLLSILAGMEPPDSGTVVLDGLDLWSLDSEGLTAFRGSRIGIVFQDYHLIPSLTALENVSLPLEIHRRSEPHRKARELLDRVGLGERAKHYPHQLSGGEQQRVAMARALSTGPSLLLADEPTGSLDESTASEVEELMFGLVQELDMTMLLITHNRILSGRCAKTFTLRQGRLEKAQP